MTEIAATSIALHQTPGKRNMASAAFAELRLARLEGRAPEGQDLSFADLVDTLNPLQHIPVVSEIYRHVTGDAITPQARVAGGTLYGGPVGGIASVLSLAISGNAGQGAGDALLASFMGGDAAQQTQIASAEEPARTAEEAAREAPAAEAPLTTASITAKRPAEAPARPAAPAPQMPMAKLSPEAFDALLGAFGDPTALRDATASLMDADEDEAVLLSSPATGPAPADAGLVMAMQQAMDKYEALQKAR
ncbi:MAG: hypothetical protein LPK88_12025 [Alphaproteobacteria bacterium]|jgi:hypothetical protein|nr:hypothetical protein [Alphaproteobacteria bacterium]MDX5417026.1 hypothetical protein [Alphaproteobacteria bacterium]MDX5494429.1 hypothetical protein [Alphaproteobacteria bacterium]